MENEHRKQVSALSPTHVGWGYQAQRRYIEEVDKNQDRLNQVFHKNVVQPQVEKAVATLEKER